MLGEHTDSPTRPLSSQICQGHFGIDLGTVGVDQPVDEGGILLFKGIRACHFFFLQWVDLI